MGRGIDQFLIPVLEFFLLGAEGFQVCHTSVFTQWFSYGLDVGWFAFVFASSAEVCALRIWFSCAAIVDATRSITFTASPNEATVCRNCSPWSCVPWRVFTSVLNVVTAAIMRFDGIVVGGGIVVSPTPLLLP